MATSQAILGIECTAKVDVEYLYYVMQNLRPAIAQSGQQGTQSNLTLRWLRHSHPAAYLAGGDCSCALRHGRRDRGAGCAAGQVASGEAGDDEGVVVGKGAARMSDIGQIERKTQNRVVKLLRDQLGYDYAGNLEDAENSNVMVGLLTEHLHGCGYSDALVTEALETFEKAANDSTKSLYDRNRQVYELLRYGVKVKPEHGALTETVELIDWAQPLNNTFTVAEEVTVVGKTGAGSTKRPDVVLYVNGIALGVIELKRSTVSVTEGIRQNLDNQRPEFIQHFFSTMQWVMAGNDTQGLRYGTIQTPEKYYLTWKEDSPVENLDRSLLQVCEKARFLG